MRIDQLVIDIQVQDVIFGYNGYQVCPTYA